MYRRFLIALVLVVLVCGGLVGFNLFRTKMIAQFFAHMPAQTITVSATKIEPVTWTPEIDAIGTAFAIQGVDVASQVSGVVKSVAFAANQHINSGELLVQIDDAVERADVMSAQSAVERDKAQLTRVQRLRQTGVNSEASLDDAQSAIAASTSTLAKIQAVLDQKAIEAPFSGMAGIPRIDVGQYIEPGTVIATLQQVDTMKVDFTVPEQFVDQLKLGQPVAFGLTDEAFPYRGKITGIDPKVDPGMRLISVRAELPNLKGELRPGQFVRVRVELPPVPNVIAVPQTAVVTSLYGDYVYVAQAAPPPTANGAAPAADPADKNAKSDDPALRASIPADAAAASAAPADPNAKLIARQVFVQAGRRNGNLIEIASGLAAGQTVITSGQNKLSNNTLVKIDNSVDPAAIALDGEPPKS